MNHFISAPNVQFVSKLTTACVLFTFAAKAQDLDFSLTPESPRVPVPFLAIDDIHAGGATTRISGADLGVMPTNDVTGLSYGQAEAADINATYFIKRLAFSVDTNATGVGAPVATERTLDGAAGDTFALDFVGFGGQRFVIRRPFNVTKAQIRNLTVKTNTLDPEDDIDALALFRGTKYPVYATFPPGSGFDPASIYMITNQGGPPQLFASSTNLGLIAGDVIDAFVLGTIPFGGPPPTALNSSVVIWISLKSGSPSQGVAGDDIQQAWPAPRGTVLYHSQLNLTVTDEINALAVLDPAPAIGVTMTDGLPIVVWTGNGLQASGSPEGPFTNVADATSPLEVPPTEPLRWFRSYLSPQNLEPVPSPTTNELFAVWGSAPNDVYAVGNNGVVIHYDGQAWNIETDTPPTTNRLSCIYSAGPDELYFGGSDGLFRRNATGWSENIGPAGVVGVTGITKTPNGELHIVAGRRWMTRDINSNWRTNGLSYPPYISIKLLANGTLHDVSHLVDVNNQTTVILAGVEGVFVNGRNLPLSGGNAQFQSIWTWGTNTVMAGNQDGVSHYEQRSPVFDLRNSQNWVSMTGANARIAGIHGDSSSNVYAVGSANTIPPGRSYHFDGNESNEWSSGQLIAESLNDVWVSGDFVVAVGQGIYMK